MTLSALIRGTRKVAKVATVAVANPEEEVATRGARNFATAIPAIPATQPEGEETTVAKIATVAVANPEEAKTAPLPEAGAGEARSVWWRLHFADREPVEVCCCPEATHAEVLEWHPGAVAAEPFTPTITPPEEPLDVKEEAAIRAWLALIKETDPAIVAAVIEQCRGDAAARSYFLERAAEELPAANLI
jgi:hypothetical protein